METIYITFIQRFVVLRNDLLIHRQFIVLLFLVFLVFLPPDGEGGGLGVSNITV